MIKVGVIGCGKISQVRHLPEYADNKNVVIAAVFDMNEERANAVGNQYGAVVYNTYEEILNNPEIDAVSVCVANVFHCEITVAALRAGKHVLCEKPMAVKLDECEKMVQVARETGKYLMIGHNQRLVKTHAKARELVMSGEIGEVITFRTVFGHCGPETWAIDSNNVWFFNKEQAVFGAMADLGIHKTDLIQFLTGQKISAVTAYLGTLDKRYPSGDLIGVDDNAMCIYKMEDGVVGTMMASWTFYGEEDNSTILYGTEGIMRIYDNPEYSIVLDKKDGTCVKFELDQIQTNANQTKSGVIDMWVDCLVNGHQPEISGEEALSAMKAVFAALESSETGKTVKIK